MSAYSGTRGGGGLDGLRGLYDDALIIRMIILKGLRSKYRDNPLGLLLEFLKPVIICTVHYFYFAYAGRDVPDDVYLAFVLGGFSIWFCFITAYSGTLEGRRSAGGVTNIPGVTLMHVCLAKSIWSCLLFFMFAYLVAVPAAILGTPISPPAFLLSFCCYGLAACLGFAFGLVTKAIAVVIPPLSPFLKLFRWALFISSGIYGSLSTVSHIEAGIVIYNPLIHLAEYERHALDPGYPVFHASLAYPCFILVVLLFFGLASNRALARRGRGMNGYFA
jgi:ABC-type polysaccharide/polyol phosphate export permease